MKHTLLMVLPVAITLCSCATDPYGSGPNAAKRTIYGASAGAAIGAVARTAMGDPLSGAAAGAAAGGAIGALIPASLFHGRQYYRDTRGYCYRIDRNGKPRYAPKVRC